MKTTIELPKIKCPSCEQHSKELEWNMYTSEVVSSLNDKNTSITFYVHRKEGTMFRCPKCEDELITDNKKVLRVQDENGMPIVE